MLTPSHPVPALALPTLSHGPWSLADGHEENGTLLVFYRGLHCPICIRQLTELEEKVQQFKEVGVRLIAVTADDADKASQTAERAGVHRLPIAYDLPLKAGRDDWGLLMSSAREGSAEPAVFPEPGHFYVLPDGTLYAGWVQTAPFARPKVDDILGMIRFKLEKNYPPRGLYTGAVPGDVTTA